MRAIMISINPQWVEKILNGEKTIEVRKTKPKLETPFKCYIYCTQQGKIFFHGGIGEKQVLFRNPDTNKIKFDYAFELMCCENKYTKNNFLSGKVVAEFTCDRINEYDFLVGHGVCGYVDGCESHCLTREELCEYGNGKNLYGWHISNLKVYDTPKELGEFYIHDKTFDNSFGGYWTDEEKNAILKRPPQSWCYVEEI